MHDDSRSDTAAARIRFSSGRTEVIQSEDLVWPPPPEDLRAFTVIKVGEDDERAASLLVVAGVAAQARPQPAVAAPAPARAATPTRAATPPARKSAAPRDAVKPRGATVPRAVVPPGRRQVTSPWALPRWARVGLFATALGLAF